MSSQQEPRFEIIRLLGDGGQGKVYLAKDLKFKNRLRALKLLPADFVNDPESLERFKREAEVLGRLNNPHIVDLCDIGETPPPAAVAPEYQGKADVVQFIATEYVEGITLHKRLKDKADPLTFAEKINIAIQVADALIAAHETEERIIHRDIKPLNIMIRRVDGEVKVLDFGIAKLLHIGEDDTTQKALTKAGVAIGTYFYMSPEQIQGQEVDERTDIWSLGVVLYEMITGQAPFRGYSFEELKHSIEHGELVPITQFDVDAPVGVQHELQFVLKRALDKKPQRRFQSVKDMRIELENLLLEVEPVPPRPPVVDPVVPVHDIPNPPDEPKPEPGREPQRIVNNPRRDRFQWLKAGKRRGLVVVTAVVLLILAAGAIMLWVSKDSKKFLTSPPDPPLNSLAVLPFTPSDENDKSLGRGMADTLIVKLSKLPQVTVLPISAVAKYTSKDEDVAKAEIAFTSSAIWEPSFSIWKITKGLKITPRKASG